MASLKNLSGVGKDKIQSMVRNERDRERVRDDTTEGRKGASRVALPAYTKAELCGFARSSFRLRAAITVRQKIIRLDLTAQQPSIRPKSK